MIYRSYGKTGFSSSLLGMGCMRLPQNPQTHQIDQEKAIAVIRHAIDSGINYCDTAYAYAGSEEVLGLALRDGYRERVKIATKVPPREIKKKEDVREKLLIELERLGVPYVDFYLIHRVESTTWPMVRDMGIVEALDELKKEGLCKGVGFSYHDTFEVFEEILNYYPWDMCQVQQNYLDWDREVTERGIRLAGEKGVALVIMEPLRGGALVNVPREVSELFAAYPEKRTQIDWAFRYLYNFPEISCILSGMNTIEQIDENVAYFSDANDVKPDCLSQEDIEMLHEAKAILDRKMMVKCTGCFYCMPCPNGVGIPGLFQMYNNASVFDDWAGSKATYARIKTIGIKRADDCIECGACEAQCPQHLPIIEKLKEVHKALAE